MVDIDDYNEMRECDYRGEHYSVRDNGSILRHQRKGKPKRKYDDVWTFGKPNEKKGYMYFSSEFVHRIVAYAFHGAPPADDYVVDHIDTNRRNNIPENLRWLTKLENVLKNPITRARIENICGSIEKFLENPSILRWHEKIDPNFKWMHTVTPQSSLYNWGPPVFCLFFSDSAFGSFVNIYTANVGKITNSKSVISAYIYEPK